MNDKQIMTISEFAREKNFTIELTPRTVRGKEVFTAQFKDTVIVHFDPVSNSKAMEAPGCAPTIEGAILDYANNISGKQMAMDVDGESDDYTDEFYVPRLNTKKI